jgi:ABC-type multidrug transport system fused ATPase/permease subunit
MWSPLEISPPTPNATAHPRVLRFTSTVFLWLLWATFVGQLVQYMAFSVEPSTKTVMFVDKLSVTYVPDGHQPVHALNQATLEIQPGELVGILGESGSGKSTLAAAVLRILPANAQFANGSLKFRGRSRQPERWKASRQRYCDRSGLLE